MARLIQPAHYNPRSCVVITDGTAAFTTARNMRWKLDGVPHLNRIGMSNFETAAAGADPLQAAPLVPNGHNGLWRANAFVLTPVPTRDVVASILRGERRGWGDTTAHEVLRMLEDNGHAGAGGLVPLAALTAQINERDIEAAVRRVLNEVAAVTRELHDGEEASVLVLEAAGVLGGSWGMLDAIHDVVLRVAHNLGIHVTFERIVLYPGIHPSNDMKASEANAFAFSQEFAARSTGRYYQLRLHPETGEIERRRASFTETFLVSDMNNAPDTTAAITTPQLLSLVAEYLMLRLTTPFGAALDARLVDHRDDALERNRYGERRTARSFGLTTITINRERILRYSTERLVDATLRRFYSEPDEGEIEEETRRFTRTHHLREGAGFSDLSNRLRVLGHGGQEDEDLALWFEGLLNAYTDNLKGIDLLVQVPEIYRLTREQTSEEIRERLSRAATVMLNAVVDDIERYVHERLWRNGYGVSYVREWLAFQDELLEQIIQHARQANLEREERVQATQERFNAIIEQGIPPFEQMGRVRRWVNRKNIRRLATQTVNLAKALAHAQIARQAGEQAVDMLESLRQTLQNTLVRVNGLQERLDAAVAHAATEQERIASWTGILHTPRGISLDDDLPAMYVKVLRRPDDTSAEEPGGLETRAVQHLVQQLSGRIALLDADPETPVDGELRALVLAYLCETVESLHVQRELLERYPLGSNELERFLKERDREAFELVRLSGVAVHDNGEQVLRFMCGDGERHDDLVQALNEAAHGRNRGEARYTFVGTGDREKLALVHVRLSFPISQVTKYKACRESYEERRKGLEYEKMHTELVGRSLPEPGVRATDPEVQEALVKAFVLGALHPGSAVAYCSPDGETAVLGDDLAALRRYDLRVEIATLFFCAYRLFGPHALRRKLADLESLMKEEAPDHTLEGKNEPGVARWVANRVSSNVIETIHDEIAWYESNTIQQAALWQTN